MRPLRAGQIAEGQQDFDRAVVEYTKALRERPNDRTARASLEQAKIRAAQDHFARARRLASTGKFEEALVEYGIAGELNPANAAIQDEMTRVRLQLRAKIAVNEGGKTQLETVIEQSLSAPLPGADLPDDVDDARHVGVSRGEQPGHLCRDCEVHEPQYRLRSDISRSADQRRFTQHQAARRAQRRRAGDAQLLESHRSAHARRSSPTRLPNGASTRKRSSARFT